MCIEPGVVATELMEAITDKALEKYVERTKQKEALQAEDIANAIMFAVEAPQHVNVNEILVRPMTQERLICNTPIVNHFFGSPMEWNDK